MPKQWPKNKALKRKSIIRYCYVLLTLISVSCNRQKSNLQENDLSDQSRPDTLIRTAVPVKMVYIPGGEYKPFYGSDSVMVRVDPFLIDERAVTNSEFLQFVTHNPQWRRSNIKKIFSDSTYLKNWPSDLSLPPTADPDAPVCYVSWFAAKAFAHSAGKRLPTLDEWEFIAMSDEVSPNARSKPDYSDAIIDLYLKKDRQYKPVKQSKPNYWGVYNMFDLIWEWTDDFNSILSTNDSRAGQYDDKNLFCAGNATSATDILNYAAFMRFAMRTSLKANYTVANLGFRCAKDTIHIKQPR